MNHDYDIVSKAEQVMLDLQTTDRYNNKFISLSVSQIRKFLTAVNLLKNKVDIYKYNTLKNTYKAPTELSEDLAVEIKFLRVNILYQVGRDSRNGTLKKFVELAQLDKIISDIGTDINKFYQFCKYMEALVAFHKFYGGKD